MAQEYYSNYQNRNPQRRPTRRRRKRNTGVRLALIAFLGMAAFAGGFFAMWFLGSWIVGGRGSGGQSASRDGSAALLVPVREDYEIEPLVDLLAFRDLAYVPVRAFHVTSAKASDTASMGRIIALVDRTEINAIVMAVKDDRGYVAYDSKCALALKYGTVKNIIGDIDSLLATMAAHGIMPIARVVCFKDSVLVKQRPDLGVQSSDGGLWADYKGQNYLNPYNHEVWEYVVQVAEDVARRGFREIQFDYVRFPDGGDLNKAVYPGQYCSKEDAVAGFLAYARPRLEALGVWVSCDTFGLTVASSGDGGIGQQLEKMCQNVDIYCPMIYPSLYSMGSYGVEYPAADPVAIVTSAMSDAATRLAGTGAKGRPYVQVFNDYNARQIEYTDELIQSEIRAIEALGFDEWILWGGYPEGALRGETSPFTTETAAPAVTTTVGGQ
jgi:hypothetical protein